MATLKCIISSTEVDKEKYLATLPQINPNFAEYRWRSNAYILSKLGRLEAEHKSIYRDLCDNFYKFYNLSISESIDKDIEGAKQYASILMAMMYPHPNNPVIIRQIENGLHPWVLAHVVKGLFQNSKFNHLNIIITTNSPTLLNMLEPAQIAVATIENGLIALNPIMLDAEPFKSLYDAYEGNLGDMWYVNAFGGNPTMD
jgi:hypothetical protein